ncbi:hypothetical protein Ancab_036515 [Ancistrocladus abbreviatus]
MNHNSPRKDLDAFDFKDELEVEQVKWTPKCRKSNFDNSPLDKYRFLECVARPSNFHSRKNNGPQCVDVDASDDDDQFSVDEIKCTLHGNLPETFPVGDIKHTPLGFPLEDGTPKRLEALNVISDSTAEGPCNFSDDNPFPKGLSTGTDVTVASSQEVLRVNDHISSTIAESPSNNGLVGAVSPDVVDSIEEGYPSTPSSVLAENYATYGQARSYSSSVLEMDKVDIEVILNADYVAYRNKYWPTSLISFSNNSFKIEALHDQKDETCRSEWGVDDIQNIVCQWSSRNKIVAVGLQLLVRDADGLSGFEELKFVVYDPGWLQRQEKIMSLDVRYRAIWKIVLNVDDKGSDGGALAGENHLSFAMRYFPDFDMPFEDFVYPEGDADAVSISKRDVDLLQPETFINDTIIDFYINFFFRKLADLDKNTSSAFDAKAAFQCVRKWTRKFDLFEKDYVFIPVNYNLHWSLIVICHPGEVVSFEDEETCKSSKVPCILHMDSIRGSHAGLKNLVQSYLWEEWKERRKETSEDISSKFLNLRFVPLELPQQENCYDCGLFLLHYVELFVTQAPANFNPFKITRFSNFLNVDWFMPAEVSLKRAHIQKLIRELIGNCAQNNGSTSCNDEIPSSKVLATDGNENGIEFVSERSPEKPCNGSSLYCQPGIELSLLGPDSVRSSHCVSEDLALRGLFEPGISAGQILQYHQCDLGAAYASPGGAMSPIEEEDEASEHHEYSPSCLTGFRQLNGFASEPSNIRYTSELLGAGLSWNPGISEQMEDKDDSSPISNNNSDNSEMETMEDDFETIAVPLGQSENLDQPNCSLRDKIDGCTESSPAASCDVPDTPAEDSQGSDNVHCVIAEADLPSSATEDAFQSCHEEQSEHISITGADEQLVVDDSSSDSDVQQAPKRLRYSPSVDGESMRLERSPPTDV